MDFCGFAKLDPNLRFVAILAFLCVRRVKFTAKFSRIFKAE